MNDTNTNVYSLLDADGHQCRKRCSHCGKIKPLTEFARNCLRPDGRTLNCYECRRREYRDAHGGLRRALRRFATDELQQELNRREAETDRAEKAKRPSIFYFNP